MSIDGHIRSVRNVIDLIDLDDVAVVGHDSGGLIARHAVAGHPRLRAMGLIDIEQPSCLSWRFKTFLAAFVDSALLDGEFEEFFLRPLNTSSAHCDAAVRLLRSFDGQYVDDLAEIHRRIDVPVQLIWGDQDAFFPVDWAEQMVGSFPDARLEVIPGAGLFAHEERPAKVARALLPILSAPRQARHLLGPGRLRRWVVGRLGTQRRHHGQYQRRRHVVDQEGFDQRDLD